MGSGFRRISRSQISFFRPSFLHGKKKRNVSGVRILAERVKTIIVLTKMMTSDDLRFYEFDAGVPVVRWRSGPSGL